MGIPIIPPPKVDNTGCLACFDAGETPVHIWVDIAGIVRGGLWNPVDGPPPNGLWQLEYTGPCLWSQAFWPWHVEYRTAVPGTVIYVVDLRLMDYLAGHSGNNCHSWFALAAHENMIGIFEGGFAIVTMTADCPIISLSALAESVGLHPGSDLYAEPYAIPDEKAVILFANVPESTRVRILYDCS